MENDEWINQRVKMIAEGFSLEQIQRIGAKRSPL